MVLVTLATANQKWWLNAFNKKESCKNFESGMYIIQQANMATLILRSLRDQGDRIIFFSFQVGVAVEWVKDGKMVD